MIKKWFVWTERDIAAWEKIRAQGLARFILWYGVGISGGGLFLLIGSVILLQWIKNFLIDGTATMPSLIYLLLQTAFLATLTLLGGLVNSLVTWLMEETIYRRIYRLKRIAPPSDDFSSCP